MSTFVLVHGAWHGSWCWKRVRRALAAPGHEVFTPTLTGVADRSHLLSPRVDLDTHITDLVNLIRWEELHNIVLCGHSYAGCVVSGVADRIPDRIGSLVYLDAFVLENGQSLLDTLPAAEREAQLEGARTAGDGWKVPPIPVEVFNVNGDDRDWVTRQYTVQSLACFQQPIRLTGALDRVKNVTYVFADGWTGSPFPQFLVRAQTKGWKTITVASGHDVMLDQPDETVSILLAAAPPASAKL